VAGEQLALPVSDPKPIPIQFGIPEITLIALYVAAWIGHRRKFKYTKQMRWATLITGMLVLGFWYNLPLTISRINSFLLGFWPQWQTNIYWYLLIGGIIFVAFADNKNAYCSWFCPFGAAQECMGVIGGTKYNIPRDHRRTMLWVVRGLAWLAIVIAFLFRNPGISSYEVFGTLFSFTGSTVAFVLLGIVLIVSLFVKRPWCNYLCPLDPVYDIIHLVRAWSLELWDRIRHRRAAPSN
jgi:NosR/NirI family nitrous oxide reductase transcriptional regulator